MVSSGETNVLQKSDFQTLQHIISKAIMNKTGLPDPPVVVAFDTFLDETMYAKALRVVEMISRYQPGIELTVVRDSYLAAAIE